MMNKKYIKIKLTRKNEFRAKAQFKLFGVDYGSVDVKIDTGCPRTTILTRKIGVSETKSQLMKERALLDKNVKKSPSFGVNDTETFREQVKTNFKKGIYTDINAISFQYDIYDVSICGVSIKSNKVKVNFDRTGNILIGMDILKDWDIHIGTISTGETIFLACPKDRINDEYLLELEKLFGIGTAINKSLAK